MLSNVEFAFLTRMNWAGLEWRMPVHPILSIKNNRRRSSPYQLDNRRWRIGGLCPIVKLSMPKELGGKKTGRSFAISPKPQSLLIQMFFLQGQIKTKYNKENRCKLFFFCWLRFLVFWNSQDLSTINRLHVRFVESCWWSQSFYHLGCWVPIIVTATFHRQHNRAAIPK